MFLDVVPPTQEQGAFNSVLDADGWVLSDVLGLRAAAYFEGSGMSVIPARCPTFVRAGEIGRAPGEGSPALCFFAGRLWGRRTAREWTHIVGSDRYELRSRQEGWITEVVAAFDFATGELARALEVPDDLRHAAMRDREHGFSDITWRASVRSFRVDGIPTKLSTRCGGTALGFPGRFARDFAHRAAGQATGREPSGVEALSELDGIAGSVPEVYDWICPQYVMFLRERAQSVSPPPCARPFQASDGPLRWWTEDADGHRHVYEMDSDDRTREVTGE